MWGAFISKWLGSKKSKKEPVELEETEDKNWLKKKKEDEDNNFAGYLKSTKGYQTYKKGQKIGQVLGLWK